MIEFLKISEADDFQAIEIYKSYCETFPENERRNENQFKQLFKNPKTKVYSLLNERHFIGYIIAWELTNCVFLEHFEVFSEFRSQKFGSESIKQLSQNYSKIVLEAEPAHLDETASKRIEFYRRNGFEVIDENYIQPAYSPEKSPINLWLMANYKPENLVDLIEEINDVVYRQ